MMQNNITAAQIDALLPQSQCGDCGYRDCLSYAKAIISHHETINRCLPGGINTLEKLGQVLQQDISPLIDDLKKNGKSAACALILEEQCIGCTKCIQACPVDAIIGSAKQMHTIISQKCTGCSLCVKPCPVDCIEMLPIAKHNYDPKKARSRYYLRNQRLQALKQEQANKHTSNQEDRLAAKRAFIKAAVERAKATRNSKKAESRP